jgi:hypothetical protein
MDLIESIACIDHVDDQQFEVDILDNRHLTRTDPFEIYNENEFYLRYRFHKQSCREIINILYESCAKSTKRHDALTPENHVN